MTFLWNGCPYPITLQPGDLLFIAGMLPTSRNALLPFEHVALVAERRTIRRPEELMDVPVYGMPESEASGNASPYHGITLGSGRLWSGSKHVGVSIGSSTSVWNLGCRQSNVDTLKAQEISYGLAQRAGSFNCSYDSVFVVEPTLSQPVKTNCLGFVCSVLEYFDLQVVTAVFPPYPSPYRFSPGARNFPSPGHLAHALNLDPTLHPWTAKNSTEAARYARADVTLEKLSNLGRKSYFHRAFRLILRSLGKIFRL
jgi:hypothetical protein